MKFCKISGVLNNSFSYLFPFSFSFSFPPTHIRTHLPSPYIYSNIFPSSFLPLSFPLFTHTYPFLLVMYTYNLTTSSSYSYIYMLLHLHIHTHLPLNTCYYLIWVLYEFLGTYCKHLINISLIPSCIYSVFPFPYILILLYTYINFCNIYLLTLLHLLLFVV